MRRHVVARDKRLLGAELSAYEYFFLVVHTEHAEAEAKEHRLVPYAEVEYGHFMKTLIKLPLATHVGGIVDLLVARVAHLTHEPGFALRIERLNFLK